MDAKQEPDVPMYSLGMRITSIDGSPAGQTRSLRQTHWLAFRPPRSVRAGKDAGTGCSAELAMTLVAQMPGGQDVPITADDVPAARMAIGTAPSLVVDIARVVF